MKKIVIHLKERKDREELYKYELGRFFDDYEVFDAIKINPGYIGISESFKELIRQNINEDQILVFEDDVKFTSNKSIDFLNKCIKDLPEDWDILLGGSYHFDSVSKTDNLIKVGDFSSGHCMLINKKAYNHFLNHNTKEHKYLDRYLGALSHQKTINVYLCDPMISIQYPGYSDNVNKQVDYSNMLASFNILKD